MKGQSTLMQLVRRSYVAAFAKPQFFRFNAFLHRLALGGMGVLNWQDDRQSGEAWFVENLIRNKASGVVIDVGAHDGDYIDRIRRIAPSLTVYGFEPHPVTYARLAARHSAPTIKLVNAGVGASASRMSLFDYSGQDGSQHASLVPGVIEKVHAATPVEHAVDVVTLDDFARQHGIDFIDFLKIDTEGNEYDVLVGASGLLKARSIGAIQFEFNSMNVMSRHYLKDFLTVLEDYELFRLLPNSLLPIRAYDPIVHEIFGFQNIVAILKNNIADWQAA